MGNKDESQTRADAYSGDIAIVGLSVCLPGAESAAAFWRNLRDGIESIEVLDEASLLEAGERTSVLSDPNYVPAAARLEGYDEFDADFFGFSPKEAAILDPQHRKFLEVAWGAMEDAGHPPESLDEPIGVYAGCGMGSYFYFNICSNPTLVDEVGMFLLRHTGNDKDFLSTRVSHVFDLKGPSVNIQTACSTSLVAVHYACKALREGECGMALAGGVTIELPQGRGYLYKENEILSPDGHCHAFDHRAQGTVFGSGAGAVALRRLEDAIADGDHIWAVIKGSAINNDGADKAGYLAPSVGGQATAVRKALAAADVAAETIDYVECHGTGTYLGDPIEVTALTEAYRDSTEESGFCRIGSVKTNIGHLDTAAGVAGLAKTALALKHQQIPASLGYEAPNPAIDFDGSPFKVNAALSDWQSHSGPRRAAVNALGVGGTNAHVILEEAPDRGASDESDFPFHVLCISGRSKAALDDNSAALAAWLRQNPEVDLADVAYTLKEGRRGFAKRRVLVAETASEAADLLETGDPRKVFTHDHLGDAPEVVFMFPGGGAQYAGMARDLYETEPVFADWMDRGIDHLQASLDYDIRALWLPEEGQEEAANAALQKPSVQLPLIMIVEYALAQLWISWGVRPAALVGHSMGENTAACLAGVISFEDCIDLVLLRGRLFDTVPAGGMLSVSLPLAEVEALIGDDLDIASVNAPRLTAVSGPQAALDRLAKELSARDIDHQRIQIDIAAHSRMLDGILEQYGAFLRGLTLSAPQIPVMSNRSGKQLTPEQATDPDYWVSQLRGTVQFGACIDSLAEVPGRIYLEVGPGKALSALAQMAPAVAPGQALSSLRHPEQDVMDDTYFFGVIGRLWACGYDADWDQIWGEAKRHRLPLPTYAFQRSRYFIEPGTAAQVEEAPLPARHDDIDNWGYRAAWRPRLADCALDVDTELDQDPQCWLIFEDDIGLASQVADRLVAAGHAVVRLRTGDTYAQLSPTSYILAPEQGRAGYAALLADLARTEMLPTRIAHFWLATEGETFRPGSSFFDRNLETGFYALTALAQELGSADLPQPPHITVFTTGAVQLRDEALPDPEKAMIAGPARVIPRELPGFSCATVDIELPRAETGLLARIKGAAAPDISSRLLEELLAEPTSTAAAWRGEKRYELDWRPVELPPAALPTFKKGGTYLITGGYGGIGLSIARHLLEEYAANVILISREGLPERGGWAQYLRSHSPANRTATRIRAVEALEEIGKGAVLPLAADVCNSGQMRAALKTAEDRFGPLTGVIHGAGSIDDGPLLAKSDEQIAKVLAPKVSGLRVLDSLFPDGSLDLMVLFSSSSTVTGPAGQVDYIAANEYLNAWAAHRRGGKTRVVAVDWGVWADTGMASEAMAARQGSDGPSDPVPCAQALLDSEGFDGSGNRIYRTRLDAGRHWLLNEHRTADGTAVMPGTGYIELAAEAMTALGMAEDGALPAFELHDLYFLRPLVVADDSPADLLIRLLAEEDGYALSFYTASGEGYALHAEAKVTFAETQTTAAPVDLSALAARCPSQTETDGARLKSPQEANLLFGPRWHVLQRMAFGSGEGIATLQLADAAKSDGTLLHPGLLDLATGWAIALAPGYSPDHLWVPLSYRAIRIHAPLTETIHSHIRLSAQAADAAGEGTAVFDVTLCDDTGRVLVEIEGFRMQRMTQALAPAATAAADVSAAGIAMGKGGSAQPLSPEERRLHHNIANGIRAEDGGEALTRALAAATSGGLSQVVVSALDLPALIEQAKMTSSEAPSDSQSFERPQLDTDYVAPENAVEEVLAGYFQTLLGVGEVGTRDSFFDLGGHSLIAVRLFAQIKRDFGVEFPLSVLFEAPSVADLATRIIARTGGGVTTEGSAQSPNTTDDAGPEPFTHLVKLHAGDGTGRRPFFLVAGMFGNVLNLRHLAQMLGSDRPVYGLQARGLIGDVAPHDNIAEAAADYLHEVRQIQPQGPYLLGGFSGGGITAYEMAQQLKAAGEETAALVLLDTPLPLRPPLSRQDKALIKLQELRRKGPSYLAEWARNRVAWEIAKRQRRQGSNDAGAAPAFNNRQIEMGFRAAVASYELQPWDGAMSLFRPPLDQHWQVSGGNWVSAEREYVFADNDWTRWAPEIEVIEVPGDHDSMVLVPNVSVLAAEVKARLDRAEAGYTAPVPVHAGQVRNQAAE
ncbi:polyketide synthase [Phaeobacter gallaeciensis]|uniref:Polyketide synthase n=1 Tax=Phaeobacter gallaeciensis TaxID=60890 RepID=A0A1B0ZWU3_9RHOB|nr:MULTISPECIES: type I polyketide synthase [Phaeobacter]ANP38696.1 polyketide synthase [Phaeobacter gallaeciensis]MEE2634735.1 beta-ketoacyl synthase N-terminal-like domain-containing protein [Pseudomonadota bacterium]